MRAEAFKAHENRLRTRVFQEFHGYQQQDDSVRAGRLPGMMSQGRVHRRFVTARLQALSDQGHEPAACQRCVPGASRSSGSRSCAG